MYMSLKDNLNALGKTQKSAISIPIEQEVTKMVMKVLPLILENKIC